MEVLTKLIVLLYLSCEMVNLLLFKNQAVHVMTLAKLILIYFLLGIYQCKSLMNGRENIMFNWLRNFFKKKPIRKSLLFSNSGHLNLISLFSCSRSLEGQRGSMVIVLAPCIRTCDNIRRRGGQLEKCLLTKVKFEKGRSMLKKSILELWDVRAYFFMRNKKGAIN